MYVRYAVLYNSYLNVRLTFPEMFFGAQRTALEKHRVDSNGKNGN